MFNLQVNPDVLFSHYVYVSGTSQVFLDHFSDYVKDVEQLVDKKGLV